MPEFSIITCTYNCSRFIDRCYQSILDQNDSGWEWIVVDDCSEDNTYEKICRFNDQRIKYFRLEKNMGRGMARNYALKVSNGEWCIMLDMDDLMMPNRLKEARLARQNGYEFMVSSTILINDKYLFTGVREVLYNKKLNIFTHATLCVRTTFIKSIGYSNSRYAEDQRVILMVSNLGKGYYNEMPLYIYHENASLSLSGAITSNKYAFLNIFNLFLKNPKLKWSYRHINYLFSFLFKFMFLSLVNLYPSLYIKLINRRVKSSVDILPNKAVITELLQKFSIHFPIN